MLITIYLALVMTLPFFIGAIIFHGNPRDRRIGERKTDRSFE